MSNVKLVRIYLEPDLLAYARGGEFNFVNQITMALQPLGFRVKLCRNSEEERLKSVQRRGYSLFHMEDPFHDQALSMRKSYFYPFWRIEASAKRWEFEVAGRDFFPDEVSGSVAKDWADKWKRWVLSKRPVEPTPDGPIYVPLQGKLLQKRNFQYSSPLDMIQHVIEHNPDSNICLGLHPGEVYSTEERDALATLMKDHRQVRLVTGRMEESLATCSMVVTQNSSAALFGYFFHRPAVLFGQIDFHHIAANVHQLGVGSAFQMARDMRPDYDKYLYWFTQLNAIKADAEDAQIKIQKILRKRGWQLD